MGSPPGGRSERVHSTPPSSRPRSSVRTPSGAWTRSSHSPRVSPHAIAYGIDESESRVSSTTLTGPAAGRSGTREGVASMPHATASAPPVISPMDRAANTARIGTGKRWRMGSSSSTTHSARLASGGGGSGSTRTTTHGQIRTTSPGSPSGASSSASARRTITVHPGTTPRSRTAPRISPIPSGVSAARASVARPSQPELYSSRRARTATGTGVFPVPSPRSRDAR